MKVLFAIMLLARAACAQFSPQQDYQHLGNFDLSLARMTKSTRVVAVDPGGACLNPFEKVLVHATTAEWVCRPATMTSLTGTWAQISGGGGGGGSLTPGAGIQISAGVVSIDPVDVPRLGAANVFTGSADFTAATSLAVPRGAGAPFSGACNVAGHVGRLYVDTANGGRLHRCLQTGGAWGWVADSAGNSIRLTTASPNTPTYTAGAGTSGILTGTSSVLFPNATGGSAEWTFVVPAGSSITSGTFRFAWAMEDVNTVNTLGLTLTVGCWPTGVNSGGAAFTLGTPVAVTLTPAAGYRSLQTAASITAAPAAPCAAGSIALVRLSRSSSDSQTFDAFALPGEFTW
jgi:hypothetical protein